MFQDNESVRSVLLLSAVGGAADRSYTSTIRCCCLGPPGAVHQRQQKQQQQWGGTSARLHGLLSTCSQTCCQQQRANGAEQQAARPVLLAPLSSVATQNATSAMRRRWVMELRFWCEPLSAVFFTHWFSDCLPDCDVRSLKGDLD